MRDSAKYLRFLVFSAIALAAGLAAQWLALSLGTVVVPSADETRAGRFVAALPPNEWHSLPTSFGSLPMYRTDHGGAVYDPDRNSVFLFGSDTHLRSSDNRIQELRIDDLRWYEPYERSPRYSLRTNAAGFRVAGLGTEMPWPIHVYDSMVYDPARRALVVVSGAQHNFVPAPGAQRDPVWTYDPARNAWSMLGGGAKATPNFFAAGMVYDPTRDTIVGYGALATAAPFIALRDERTIPRTGLWELGPDRSEWRLASPELHHWGWFNAEFDVANRAMIVFGGDPTDAALWVYKAGVKAGDPGTWEKRTPAGDYCPGGYYFPAAYDSRRLVTFYMPYDSKRDRTVTCVYDASRNVARRLPAADLPSVGLNYTMVYVANEDFFLLVSGSFSRNIPTRVWALHPDLTLLEP